MSDRQKPSVKADGGCMKVFLSLIISHDPCVCTVEQFAQDQGLEQLHSLLQRKGPISEDHFAVKSHGCIGNRHAPLDLSLLICDMVQKSSKVTVS